MRCPWVCSGFGQPVYLSSGLCSCVAGEFVWYVLLWCLLALGWCLVSVQVWRHLMSSYQLMFPGVRSSLVFSGFGLKPPASGFRLYSYSSLKTSPSFTSKAVPSVCFSFFCLLVSSGSHFCPDTRGWWWTLF